MSTKGLSSRACELAGVDELEVDLETKDPEFVAWAKTYIINLRNIEEILPFRRCWVPEGFQLLGLVVSMTEES